MANDDFNNGKRRKEEGEIPIERGDFTFDVHYGFKYSKIDYMKMDLTAFEMMAKHYEFYGSIEKLENYVMRGAVIECNFGSKQVRLDTYEDHGVIMEGGVPLMTCEDCHLNKNIYSFGICDCPAFRYNMDLPRPSGDGEANMEGQLHYECMPVLAQEWKQKESSVLIGNLEGSGFVEALREGAYLTCKYGGYISVTDLPPIVCEIINEKYITLDLLNDKGWEKIHCGFNEKNSEESSLYSDEDNGDVEIERQYRIINQDDVDELNYLFDNFDIVTKERVCAFMAMCSVETENGLGLTEAAGKNAKATRNGLKAWFEANKDYGYLYRGGGVIHLTHDYNYVDFDEWLVSFFGIKDENILNYGAEYVAFTYPWIAGVFFWDSNNLNNSIENIRKLDDDDAIYNYLEGDKEQQAEDIDEERESHEYAEFFAPIDEVTKTIVGDYADGSHKVARRRRYLYWIKNYPDVPIA